MSSIRAPGVRPRSEWRDFRMPENYNAVAFDPEGDATVSEDLTATSPVRPSQVALLSHLAVLLQ